MKKKDSIGHSVKAPANGGDRARSPGTARDARVRDYVSANTATPELARAKLREIGVIDKNGKLTKPYR